MIFPATLNAENGYISTENLHNVNWGIIYDYEFKHNYTFKEISGAQGEGDLSSLGVFGDIFLHEKVSIHVGYHSSTTNLNELTYRGQSISRNIDSVDSKQFSVGFDLYATRLNPRKGGTELSIGLSSNTQLYEDEIVDESIKFLRLSVGSGWKKQSFYLNYARLIDGEDTVLHSNFFEFKALTCFSNAYLCLRTGSLLRFTETDEIEFSAVGWRLGVELLF